MNDKERLDLTKTTEFERFVDEVVETYGAQGVGIIGFDMENILYECYRGYRDVANQKPIDLDTIFGVASITKSFTVISLLQLAERGLLNLDEKIDAYLPAIKLPQEHMPTVRQLMSHAGGFYPQERFLMKDVARSLKISEGQELSRNKELSQKGIEIIVDRVNQMTDFTGRPGEYHSYSNFSFGLLTELVQKFGEEGHYCDYVEKHILKPLNLERSFFEFQRTKEEDNIATLYHSAENATLDYEDQGFVLLGGGALKSTLRDLMAYTRLYLSDGMYKGEVVLSKEAILSMYQPRVSYKPFEGYGYGLLTGEINGIGYAGHSGGLTGVSSYFGFTRETGRGVVVLCNTSNVPSTAIGYAALKLINNQKPDWHQAEVVSGTWSAEMLEKIVGLYKSDEGTSFEIVETGGLPVMKIGKEQFKITPIEENAMWVHNKMVDSYAPILRDTEGKVRAIYSGGRMIKRVK